MLQVGDRVAALFEDTSGVATKPGDMGTVIQIIDDHAEIDWDEIKKPIAFPNSQGGYIFWAGFEELELKTRCAA